MCSPITHYLEEMFSLEGRTAVITGGGGVLCSGMAEAMAQAGATVILWDIRQEALDEKVARLHLEKIGVHLTKLPDQQSAYINVPQTGPFKPDTYRY